MNGSVENILDMVAVGDGGATARNGSTLDELPLALRQRVEAASQQAYYLARANRKSVDEAKAEAKKAFDAEVEKILAELGQAPKKGGEEPLANNVMTAAETPVSEPAPIVPATVAPAQVKPACPDHCACKDCVKAFEDAHPDDVTPAPLETAPASGPRATVPFVAAPPAPPAAEPDRPDFSAAGAARSKGDLAAAVAAGFAPAQPYYERGTTVIDIGVENARRSRVEHDSKPLVSEACTDLMTHVKAERRRIVIARASDIGMDGRGWITASEPHTPDGKPASGLQMPITVAAFKGLTSRLGYQGADYLQKCRVELRAHNVEDWRKVLAGEDAQAQAAAVEAARQAGKAPEWKPKEWALRVRDRADGQAEVFGVVSTSYPTFDCDLIADAIRRAAPPEARGRVSYDGTKARFEVMFHSDVQPEHYVAGEFFKAGVLVRTDDIGGGSCVVNAVVWQNLCRNLLCIDRCGKELARIKHVGTVFALAKKFGAAFAKGLDSLKHFLRAWGYACEEEILPRTRAAYPDQDVPLLVSKALPGLFNGILAAELVKVKGKRDAVVDALVKCWEEDDSGAKLKGLTRASLVNAFTRLAHTMHFEDPWAEDEIQRDAGKLLWGRGDKQPAPIPYLSLDEIVEETVTAGAKQAALLS